MISFEQWLAWRSTYKRLPFAAVVPLPEADSLDWSGWREKASPHAVVLESGKAGRFSICGDDAESVIHGDLQGAVVHTYGPVPEGVPKERRWTGTPLALVGRWMSEVRMPRWSDEGDVPCFAGGAIGYFGYDVARTLERLPAIAERDVDVPDYYFARFRGVSIIDHERFTLTYVTYADIEGGEDDGRLRAMYEEIRLRVFEKQAEMARVFRAGKTERERKEQVLKAAEAERDIEIERIPGIRFSFDRETFIRAAERVQAYIRAGDVFQVNLSTRQSRPLAASPDDLYDWLRLINPSPYMAYLRFPELQLVSSSPEQLIRLWGNRLVTRPIAGTRPRGRDDGEDGSLQHELILHEKERAEHTMLVDLERNDIGRVAAYGTVRVPELMTVEKYSHVMHIVSEVTGQLAEGKDLYDVLAAVFPGGTITGAPKIRTMQIIEELEPVRRGVYTGSIGWIDYHGNMEFNIVIRTMMIHRGIGYVQSGAGIVADSLPGKEYTESLNKAKALWKAAEFAGKGIFA